MLGHVSLAGNGVAGNDYNTHLRPTAGHQPCQTKPVQRTRHPNVRDYTHCARLRFQEGHRLVGTAGLNCPVSSICQSVAGNKPDKRFVLHEHHDRRIRQGGFRVVLQGDCPMRRLTSRSTATCIPGRLIGRNGV